MDTPQGKMAPSPPKIGADSLKMAKVPRELAPQVKNFQAAEGGRQIFDIAPWELTPQVTFFCLPVYVIHTFNFHFHGKLQYIKLKIMSAKGSNN